MFSKIYRHTCASPGIAVRLLPNLFWIGIGVFALAPIVNAQSFGISVKLSHQQIRSDQAFRVTLVSSKKSILRAALSVRSEPLGGSKAFVVWSQAPPLKRNKPYVFDVTPSSEGFPGGVLKGVIRYRGRIEELFTVDVKDTGSGPGTSKLEHSLKLADAEIDGKTNIAQNIYRVEARGGAGAEHAVDGVFDFSSSAKLPLGTPLVVKFIKPFLVDAVRISLGGNADKQTALFVEGSLDGQDWSTLVHQKTGIPPGRYAYRVEPARLRFIRITGSAQSTTAMLNVVEVEAFTQEAFPRLLQNVALEAHGGQIAGENKQLQSLIDGKPSSWSSDSKQLEVALSFYQDRSFRIGAVLLLPPRSLPDTMPGAVELWSAQSKEGALSLHSKHELDGSGEANVITFDPVEMVRLELHFSARNANRISLVEIEVHEVPRSGESTQLEQFVFQPLPRGLAPQTQQNTLDDLAGARVIAPQPEGDTAAEWLLQVENRTPWRIKQGSEVFEASFFADQKHCGERLLLRTSGGPAEVEISTRRSAEGPVELVSKALLPASKIIPYQWFGLKVGKLCGHAVGLRFKPVNNSSLNVYQVALIRDSIANSHLEEGSRQTSGLNIASAGLGGSVRVHNTKSRKGWPESALIDGMISDETGYLTSSPGWASAETSDPVELEFEFNDGKTAYVSGFGIHTGVQLGTGILSEAIRRNSLRSIPAEFEVFAWNGSEWHRSGGRYFLRSAGGFQRYFFEQPEHTSKLKFRLLRSYGKPFYSLGEVEIYESLQTDSILTGMRLNLLDRRLGASLVSYPFSEKRPNMSPGRVLAGGLTEKSDAKSWQAGGTDLPQSFVFSFRNQQIAEPDEVRLAPVEKTYRSLAPRLVQVWATDDLVPLRNERLIGEARWEDVSTPLVISFGKPVRMRYLRLAILEADQTRPALGIVSAFGRIISHAAEAGTDSDAARHVSLKGTPEIEPNDDTQQAQSIVLNAPVVGMINGYEDRDVFRLELPESDTKHFEIRLTGEPRLISSLEVTNEQNEPLLTFDPYGTRRTYQESLTLSPGVYYYNVFRRSRRTVLVVDNSESMNASFEFLKQSVNGYLERQEPDEKIALVTFSNLVRVLQKFTSHGLAVQRAVNEQFRASGGTALYDGITTAARLFEREPAGERVIILLTDGADTASTNSGPSDLWQQLSASGINLFVIGLGRDLSVFQERTGVRARALLETLASSTAGRFFQTDGAGDLPEIFDIIDEIVRQVPKYQLEISQSAGSGHLRVDGTEVQVKQELANTEVALLLDVSGSMAAKGKDGKRRIDISREVINDLVRELPRGSVLSLRAYGHRVSKTNKEESCKDTELIIPPQVVKPKQIETVLRQLKPKGYTPIGTSLRALTGDFSDSAGEKLVVLLTDGEETCSPEPSDPDYPPRVLEELREAGFRISLNIVGLEIDQTDAEASLKQLAQGGGGIYFSAKNKMELGKALSEAFAVNFSVRDGIDEEVGKGRIGGKDIEIPVGIYSVVLSSKPEFVIKDVSIKSNELTLINVARENETLRSTVGQQAPRE